MQQLQNWLGKLLTGSSVVGVFSLVLVSEIVFYLPVSFGDEPANLPEPSGEEVSVELIQNPGEELQRLLAKGVIDAPPPRVWAIIDDCANYKKNLVSVADSKELSRDGNTRRCSVTVAMPFPFSNLLAVSDSTNEVQEGKVWKRTWRHVDGDFKTNTGSWTLVPYGADGQQTMLTYEFQVEPSIPIPQFIVLGMQKRTVPALYKKIRSITQNEKPEKPEER